MPPKEELAAGHCFDICISRYCSWVLTSLNLAENELKAEGAKHVAEAIKVNVSTLRFCWYHFELDLTSGSVYGYSYCITTRR